MCFDDSVEGVWRSALEDAVPDGYSMESATSEESRVRSRRLGRGRMGRAGWMEEVESA